MYLGLHQKWPNPEKKNEKEQHGETEFFKTDNHGFTTLKQLTVKLGIIFIITIKLEKKVLLSYILNYKCCIIWAKEAPSGLLLLHIHDGMSED